MYSFHCTRTSSYILVFSNNLRLMPELLFAIVTISLKILKNGLLSHVYILEQIDLSKSFTFLRLCLRKLYDKEISKIVYKSIKHYCLNVYPEKSVTFNIPCHCKLYTRQNSGDTIIL